MGKHIDRVALWALAATGYYLYFLNAWGSIPLACLLAFICCELTRRLKGRLRLPRRAGRAQARSALLRVAAMTDDDAREVLEPLVRRRWPDEAFCLVPILKHPEATLSSGDVMNAWKANRDADRLVIAATCPTEPRAALYAGQLEAPRVTVLDSRALARLLRAPGTLPPEDAPHRPLRDRLRDAIAAACAQRFSLKNAAVAAALLALYWVRGNPLGLFAAAALLWQLVAALLRGRIGKKLFD